jgi:ferredoxin/flavodoxin---NADP+ reductase
MHMPYVITQGCCNDASCTTVCPVDCIHPTPDEEGFSDAEMLYIDPDSCIDCGACVPVCPVDAIRSDEELTELNLRYLEINADYYTHNPVTRMAASRDPTPSLPPACEPLRVAIVGSGPAACYAAEELLTLGEVQVDMFERLPTPWGLVRAGVAPDHQGTKAVTEMFQATTAKPGFQIHLNVEVGIHLTHHELLEHHQAVIYAHGAAGERRLEIPGAELPGSIAAGTFVGWYNGHPDFADLSYDLSGGRAVIIGNGNVALDVARILVMEPDVLSASDMPHHAVEALRHSNIREVVIVGRRGPTQAAFTGSELLALSQLSGVDVIVDTRDLAIDDVTRFDLDNPNAEPSTVFKFKLLSELAEKAPVAGNKRIVLQFLTSPVAVMGDERVTGVTLVRNTLVRDADGTVRARPTVDHRILNADLVFHSVGYRGQRVTGVPFDELRGVIPNDGGRVVDPDTAQPVTGVYTTGWIKRGSTGVIGTNKQCAHETVSRILEDVAAARLPAPRVGRRELAEVLRRRQPLSFGIDGWHAIDAVERQRGVAQDKVRDKVVKVEEMLAIAHAHR